MISRTLLLCALGAVATISGVADAQPASRQPPVLTAFALNDGAATAVRDAPVVLAHSVAGTRPTSYRASARADFAGAVWLPYVRRPELAHVEPFTTPGCDVQGSTRRLRVFLQVRATLGDEMRIVNGQRSLVPVVVESNVLADSICIGAPPPH